MNEDAFDISEIISAFKRRAWVLVLCIVLLTPIGLLVALLLPPIYTSGAKILVQSQQIPSDLIRSTVQVSSAERLGLIRQRLTTRRKLLDLADRMELYKDRPRMSVSEKVQTLRRSIRVNEIRLRQSRSNREVLSSAFVLRFSSTSPIVAARVANELVTMVLEENTASRSKRATETRQFLEKKSEDLAKELTQIEEEIVEFKATNSESLPSSLESRQVELRNLTSRRFELEAARLALEQKKRGVLDALAEAKPPPQGRTGEENKVTVLRQQLAEVRGLLSNEHPRVKSLRASIASLQAAADFNAEQRERRFAEEADEEDTPAFQLRKQRERTLELIEKQLDLVERQITAGDERAEELRNSIAVTPDTEIALSALNRKRNGIATRLEQSVFKAATAADGEILEINRQAETFEIIEPAQVPEKPNKPDRKLIALGGFGASIGVGLALMLLLELLNRTIRTSRQMAARVGVEPIVAIPLIQTQREAKQKRITAAVYILLLIGLIFTIVFLVDQYVTPIDLLVERLLDDAKLTPIVEDARKTFGQSLESAERWFRMNVYPGAS